jgi:DNA-binding MarR family transcriptional regulator
MANPGRPDTNTAALLLQAHQRLADRINAGAIERGTRMRPAHATVFIHMDRGGIRLTRLAQKANMTPQSMAELVDDLAAAGYLERVPDPTDGRAKLIVFTPEGARALERGLEVVAEVEAELNATLGPSRARDLRATLEQIIATGGRPDPGPG